MKRALPMLWVLTALAPTMSSAAEPGYIPGLWLHHDQWRVMPRTSDDPGNTFKNANAAVLNFCPGGELRLATGVMYQSTKSREVVIGASDGLAVYRGRWSRVDGVIRVEYQLVDAEFVDLLRDPVATKRHSADLGPAQSRIRFEFINIFGKPWTLKFSPAALYEKKVLDDFVTCPKT